MKIKMNKSPVLNKDIPLLFIDDKLKLKQVSKLAEFLLGLTSSDIGKNFKSFKFIKNIPDLDELRNTHTKLKSLSEFEIKNDNGLTLFVKLLPDRDSGKKSCGFHIVLADSKNFRNNLKVLEKNNKKLSELSYLLKNKDSLHEKNNSRLEKRIHRTVGENIIVNSDIKSNAVLYKSIIENYPNGAITLLDRNSNIIFTDGTIFNKLNLRKEDFIGRTMEDILPGEFNTEISRILTSAFRGKSLRNEIVYNGFAFSNDSIPVKNEKGKIVACLFIMHDITNIKKAEQKLKIAKEKLEKEIAEKRKIEDSLRILSKHLVNAQEKERLKISHELHDGVNQILSIAKLKLHMFDEKLGKVPEKELKKELKNINQHLEKTIGEVRRIAKNLRPGALEEMGIKASLNSLCEEFGERTAIDTRCVFPARIGRFSDDVELAIYRIVQEAMHNVERHAKATRIRVIMEIVDGYIRIKVRDNGEGFDFRKYDEKEEKKKGLGITGMRERAESVKGKLYVTSFKGRGTVVKVFIPIEKRSASRGSK